MATYEQFHNPGGIRKATKKRQRADLISAILGSRGFLKENYSRGVGRPGGRLYVRPHWGKRV